MLLFLAVACLVAAVVVALFETRESLNALDKAVTGVAAVSVRDRFVSAAKDSEWALALTGAGAVLLVVSVLKHR